MPKIVPGRKGKWDVVGHYLTDGSARTYARSFKTRKAANVYRMRVQMAMHKLGSLKGMAGRRRRRRAVREARRANRHQ